MYSRLPGDAGHGEQLVGGAGKAEVRQTRRLVRVTCEASGTRGASSTLVFTASSWLLSLFIIRFSLARQLSVQMGVDTGRPCQQGHDIILKHIPHPHPTLGGSCRTVCHHYSLLALIPGPLWGVEEAAICGGAAEAYGLGAELVTAP